MRTWIRSSLVTMLVAAVAAAVALAAPPAVKPAPATLHWMGHTWRVTHGGMAGVIPASPANVRLDAHGYLHLQIARRGGVWTGAELMSQDRLGFGVYQWQVEGQVFHMEKPLVLGLFLYGPAAHIGKDGQNEIDVVEFSQWNGTCGCDADFTIFFPPAATANGDQKRSWGDNFLVSKTGGKFKTVRMDWGPSQIVFTVMDGLQPLGVTRHVLKTDTYRADAGHIPQVPLPLAMNLWSFKTPPTEPQKLVIRSFQYQPR